MSAWDHLGPQFGETRELTALDSGAAPSYDYPTRRYGKGESAPDVYRGLNAVTKSRKWNSADQGVQHQRNYPGGMQN